MQLKCLTKEVDNARLSTGDVFGFSGNNQRKGKLITVDDAAFHVAWKVGAPSKFMSQRFLSGQDINISEFMHDTNAVWAANMNHDLPHNRTSKYRSANLALIDEKSTMPSSVGGALSTITMNVEVVCSASDLYNTLLEPGRVQIWSRGPAQIKPKVGAEVCLFGGTLLVKFWNWFPTRKLFRRVLKRGPPTIIAN
ncbi:hypothetical protein CcCBS67573_g06327 [Chytriomyces confervae]|uniref:Uncharacterized protein n=1 Tax=Chytriomyces confervae TaxID=246404 RepID=A0A507F6J6_9FUNG|nr:hypothetical protein CcCBS67573_g06327 [Chytriomyces confervae]